MRAKVGQIAAHLLRAAIEPNGLAADAVQITSLKVGESRLFTGVLSTATDVDVFKITSVPSGVTITADIDARSKYSGSTLDTYLRIFNSDGTQLVANDDYGGSWDSRASTTASSAGDYYVGVSTYGNDSYNVISGTGLKTGNSTGQYDVIISLS